MNSRRAIARGLLALCLHSFSAADAQWVEAADLPGGRIQDHCSIGSEHFLAMGGRIFHSDDEGASWAPLPSPGNNAEVYSVEALEGTLLAGTAEGVYRSSIKNASWNIFQRAGLMSSPALSIWTYLGYLYIGSEGTVFKSLDQGITWSEAKTGLPQDARITCFAGIVKIAVAGSEHHGVFITESMHWIPTSDLESGKYPVRDLEVFGNKVYAITTQGVLESANLGADWEPSSLTLPDIVSLLGDGGDLFAGTDRGINVSSDKGKTWKAMNEGIPDNTVILSLEKLGGTVLASTGKGVWRRTTPSAGTSLSPSNSPLIPLLRLGRQSSIFRIEVNFPNADQVHLQQVDISGRAAWSQERLPVKQGRNTLSLPTGPVPTGAYFLRIQSR